MKNSCRKTSRMIFETKRVILKDGIISEQSADFQAENSGKIFNWVKVTVYVRTFMGKLKN